MAKDRDTQRSKVYAWERELFGNAFCEQLSLDECKALAAEMYGKRVVVRDGRGTRRALAYTDRRLPTIGLPKWARNPYVVAHEVAHLIASREGYDSGHGGRFVGIYIDLMARFCGEDRDALTESAKEHGLRVI